VHLVGILFNIINADARNHEPEIVSQFKYLKLIALRPILIFMNISKWGAIPCLALKYKTVVYYNGNKKYSGLRLCHVDEQMYSQDAD
jgi:hypothetical protein